jgi:cob(I)alamin adenosyltransferase
VSKDSPRVEAYGTLDELNSYLGVVISECRNRSIARSLREIQRLLFVAGADLATNLGGREVARISAKDTKLVEEMTDELLARLPRLTGFILPGGSVLAARLQFARTVCRRAERRVVAAGKSERLNPELVPFLNRLSSYLFNLARHANHLSRVKEVSWKGGR